MQRIPGAEVRLYDKKHQLHMAVTNKKGYVLLDWVAGAHQVLVTKKGYELIDETTGMRNRKTYLTNSKYIKLKQKFKPLQSLTTKTMSAKTNTSLQNPFTCECKKREEWLRARSFSAHRFQPRTSRADERKIKINIFSGVPGLQSERE